ncbi:hypothetical protein WG66_000253, partial [Moniliophthora roreri]
MSQPSTYILPITLHDWPWARHLNPFYDTCKEESAIWCASYGAFKGRSQQAFERCDFALLASLAYPLLNKGLKVDFRIESVIDPPDLCADGNRIGCDLMNFFFVVDEYTDVASVEEARRLANIVMDALKNPHIPRPAGEWVGGEIARTFWLNSIKTGTPSFQRRFIREFNDYLDACVEQASDRSESRIRDLDTYFAIRRKTIGALPSFAVLGVHMNVPDEVFSDPIIQRLTELTVDMIILCNDFCSYNVEQARGDDSHNIIRVVMDSHGTDVQGALNYISSLHDRLSKEFLETLPNVPTFGDATVDYEVSVYIEGLGNWVRANDCWSFESHRYFGSIGKEIQRSRVVELLPKVTPPMSTSLDNFARMFRLKGFKDLLYHTYSVIFRGFSHQEPLVRAPAATE